MGNWELATGTVADRIEQQNLLEMKISLSTLIEDRLNQSVSRNGLALLPDEQTLQRIHHAATQSLLMKPGCYRKENVHLTRNGICTFEPPPWQDVGKLVNGFFCDLTSLWHKGDALDVAAYALWRISWIHPFKNGNGRTAFAFSYACLCIKLGVILPAGETLFDQLMADPGRCSQPLRDIDESYAKSNGRPNLHPLKTYLDKLLLRQMISAQGTLHSHSN